MKTKIYNIFKKLTNNDLFHYAASLSFHTILSLVPILIISFWIFSQLPAFDVYFIKIKSFIFESLLPTTQSSFIEHIDDFMSNSSSMGIVGIVFVLFVSIMFFKDYEYIVNKIFDVQKRNFWQSVSTYWTLLTLTPIALGVSFYLSTYIQNWLSSMDATSSINFLKVLPFLIIWALMFVIILISPNKKLRLTNVLIVSGIASLIWYGFKSAFVFYVFYNKTYLSLYGSFSTLMFFFLWIYISWIIFIYALNFCAFLENYRDGK